MERADSPRQTRASDFEGSGGPEDKVRQAEVDRPGDDDVTGNTQKGTDKGRTIGSK